MKNRRFVGERLNQYHPILKRECSGGCGKGFTCNGECGIEGRIKSVTHCYCPRHLHEVLARDPDFLKFEPTANCKSRGF